MLDGSRSQRTFDADEVEMNAPRIAVAATVLAALCGTAGAETMATGTDPLAVPVSGQALAGARAALPWTEERQAVAQPKLVPQVDPAAVRAASERFRSGSEVGPEDNTAAVVLAADGYAPIGAQTAPGNDKAGDYWTPERMRSARPMPMPELPADALGRPAGPGQQNR
jgi:hypothetical protein